MLAASLSLLGWVADVVFGIALEAPTSAGEEFNSTT
jgi:hypothetical protein